ncbi:MAG: flagellin [Thermodesulfobacteriota bacterium]
MKINPAGPSPLTAGNRPTLTELIEKIASGKRINRAADDGAGLRIASLLDSQVRGMGQAMRNASDAISIAQIGEGALGEAGELIGRIRTLAIQSASAANSPESRQALQAEAGRSLAALDRIGATTTYNGQRLLGGTFTGKTFQTGTAPEDQTALSLPALSSSTLGNENGRLADIDLSTAEGAQAAVAIADASLATVSGARAGLGSTINGLRAAISNLTTTSINVEAARSQVEDVDIAEQSLLLANAKVLQQAGVFAATQTGRINKENIMRLLQG